MNRFLPLAVFGLIAVYGTIIFVAVHFIAKFW